MRRYISILLGIVCLCIIGCTGKHTELLLHQADSLLLVQPDSALALLERMPHERGALSRKNAARYALLWAQATDKCFQSLLPCDSLLDVALRYYKDANPNRALPCSTKAVWRTKWAGRTRPYACFRRLTLL